MPTDALWQLALRILHSSPKPIGLHLELMSNEDLDRWLQKHHPASSRGRFASARHG